jgi:hypothetical protein
VRPFTFKAVNGSAMPCSLSSVLAIPRSPRCCLLPGADLSESACTPQQPSAAALHVHSCWLLHLHSCWLLHLASTARAQLLCRWALKPRDSHWEPLCPVKILSENNWNFVELRGQVCTHAPTNARLLGCALVLSTP